MTLTARSRHHRGRGVLQGRHAVQRLRTAGTTGGGKGIRPEAVLVHGHALQAEGEQAGQRLHPRIGEGFGGDDVAGSEQAGEHGGHPVLAPAGDEDALHGRGEAAAPHPLRARGAVLARAPLGRIGEQPSEVLAPGKSGQGAREGGRLLLDRRRRGQVRAEVDDAGVGHRARGRRRPGRRTHERAPAHLARDQPAPSGLRVRPRDRAHRDPQPVGQVAMGGQARAWAQVSPARVLGQGLRDGDVAGARALAEVRRPHCHGDNIPLDDGDKSRLTSTAVGGRGSEMNRHIRGMAR